MRAFKLLLLTFLLRVTVLLGRKFRLHFSNLSQVALDSEGSVVEKVERIWQLAQLFLNVCDVYKRVEQLPDSVESIMYLFESFGELFVDGTLGRCLKVPYKVKICQ